MTRLALIAALCLCLCGCPPIPDKNGGDPSPAPAAPSVWAALADRWAAGKIADTDELVRIVAELKDDGDIPSAAPLDKALPGLTKQNRKNEGALREEVAKKLRGIK